MAILTINGGSTSLKACLFSENGHRKDFRYEHPSRDVSAHESSLCALIADLKGEIPSVIGHRFVHGGDVSDAGREIDVVERERLGNLVSLAPLHLPDNLLGVDLCAKHFNARQVACFDTAFHATLSELARRLPIPTEFGLRRYGFHGLNYAYVAKILPSLLGRTAYGKVVVAHLGGGASLCLMEDLKSQATTMGYTPAGGVVMGTRSGDIDPGVILELARRCDPSELSDLVYLKMGLLALSEGESADMRKLESSGTERAQFAVDYFCASVRSAIGALAANSGGIDALVFTGGIGEHSALVREKICHSLGHLGFCLDRDLNLLSTPRIDTRGHKPVAIVAADEESTIRDVCIQFLS